VESVIRYYDTVTKTEAHEKGANTIPSTDAIVSEFFKPLPDGKELTFDSSGLPLITDIPPETTEQIAQRKATQYKRDRDMEYPAITSQLDDIYHNGIDAWKATIKAVKDKYPKP
jgi:hypothetical protein